MKTGLLLKTPSPNYAVVINANAGRVTNHLTSALRDVVPKNRLFLTKSQLHARDVIQYCVAQNMDAVFAGGGDGTIVDVINNVHDFRDQTESIPAVGALRLGTGNALASWLGSTSPVQDIQAWNQGQAHSIQNVQLVESEGALFPFAGLGIDAAILNDYNEIKRNAKGTWWQTLARGIRGYLIAGYTKTLPNFIRRPKVRVRIVNIGRPAFRIAPDGQEIGEAIPTGSDIYNGTCTVVACANTPYYGYKLKLFPFASMRDGRFQLRVIDMSPVQVATKIWPAWNGKLVHPGLHDYYVDRVRVIFEDAVPYQFGGEAMGYRKEITFGLAPSSIPLIRKAV
jgi:diacylglycerol kinase family enzyme